jgi:hypothetical protein
MEARDDRDRPGVERVADAAGRHVDDAGLAVLRVGEHAGLAAGVRAGLDAEAADGHREQGHADALARGEQHVELAAPGDRRDLVREVEQLVGRVAHGADGHDDVVARLAGLDDALGHALDALGVGDGRPAEFLHDQAHGDSRDGYEGPLAAGGARAGVVRS